jgi:hypothetical protein
MGPQGVCIMFFWQKGDKFGVYMWAMIEKVDMQQTFRGINSAIGNSENSC